MREDMWILKPHDLDENSVRREVPFLLGRLTDKEREVLDLLVVPNSNKEIARHLELSSATVEKRLRTVRDKLGARDRNDTARAYKALTAGLGKPVGGFSDLSDDRADDQTDPWAGNESATLKLQDAAMFDRHAPWQPASVRSSGLEDLLDRARPGTRLALAVGIAVGLALLALAGFAIVWAISASNLQHLVT